MSWKIKNVFVKKGRLLLQILLLLLVQEGFARHPRKKPPPDQEVPIYQEISPPEEVVVTPETIPLSQEVSTPPIQVLSPTDLLYAQIRDTLHPTLEDYRLIQDYLKNGVREGLEDLGDTEYRMRNLKIIGDGPDEVPQSGLIPVNCDMDDKENCLILYASFNWHYPDGLKRVIKMAQESDFKGHILYRIGGWPNVEGGSLTLAHVPYAYKVCLFKEAQRLGYKRVLWLDTSIVPLVSLNTIFQMIKEKGYFAFANSHSVGPYTNNPSCAYFGITRRKSQKITSCMSGMFGVDLTQDIGKNLIDSWYLAAQDKKAFYTSRPDQNSLSILLDLLGAKELVEIERVAWLKEMINSDTLFVIDRGFVQY
ncbi:MAG TPA: hypothetical protein VLE96_03270 [Chlamydiales bacterium]|nr:hypothetical protein [Chlamydiales bacterium]